MKKEIISASISCTGIKNKCRKNDRHFFTLKDFELADYDENKTIDLAKDFLKTRMKSVNSARLITQKERFEIDGIFETRTFFGIDNSRKVIDLSI